MGDFIQHQQLDCRTPTQKDKTVIVWTFTIRIKYVPSTLIKHFRIHFKYFSTVKLVRSSNKLKSIPESVWNNPILRKPILGYEKRFQKLKQMMSVDINISYLDMYFPRTFFPAMTIIDYCVENHLVDTPRPSTIILRIFSVLFITKGIGYGESLILAEYYYCLIS